MRSFTRARRRWLFAPTFILLALSLIAWADNYVWIPYLVAQFRLEWALLALVLLPFCVLSGNRLLMVATTIALAANIFPLADCFLPHEVPPNSLPSITVLQLNVNHGNTNYEPVRQLIENTQPDMLLIEELTDKWLKQMKPVLAELPYSETVARGDTYGIGVFSKTPLRDSHVFYFGPTGHPSIECNTNYGNGLVHVFHTHLQGPVKEHYYAAQVKELSDMSDFLARTSTRNLLFAGDMNTMSSVAPFYHAMRKLHLRDTRRGRGLQLSWPSPEKFPVPLLTIDHIFAGEDIVVLDRRIGPHVGSDHLPVILKIARRIATPRSSK